MKLLTTCFLFTLSFTLSAQDCTPWFPFQEGVAFEYTSYDKKDKVTSRVHYEVKEVMEKDGTYEATVHALISDKKEEVIADYDFEVTCKDGEFLADFSNFVNPTMKEAFGNVEVSTSGDDLIIPQDLSVGLELPDAITYMETAMGAISMKAEMYFTERKVVDKVDVETPVKTFNAFKMTGKERVKMSIINREYNVIHFYAEGYGMVRSELYDKKDKLDGYMVLTSYEE